jgi:hypothetical protein
MPPNPVNTYRKIGMDRGKIETIIRENGYEAYNTLECKRLR